MRRAVAARLAAGVRWPRLLDLAAAHGLEPLAARHLAESPAGPDPAFGALVPDAARDALRAAARAAAARNLAFAGELAELVDRLGAAGVPCLPFKGPMVALDVYGDLALRTFGDLDVVVPARQLRTARQALVAAGYASPYGLSERQGWAVLRAHGHLTLERPGAPGPVELHWRFAPDCFPSLDVGAALGRARTVRVAGRPVPTLGPEDLLITLCVHGGKHVWSALEWVCGVAELLRRDVDVAEALARAEAIGAGRYVRLGAWLAHALLGAPLGVAARVDTPATRRLAAEAEQVLARGAGEDEAGPLRYLGYHLRAQPSLGARLRFVHHVTMLPTPAEWARVRLPDWLVPAYRVARPARLALKYLGLERAGEERRPG